MNVSVLGASQKRERYSYKAIKLLLETGHTVFPVHPLVAKIDDIPVFKGLREISAPIHTITVYLGPERSSFLADDILAISPQRVISNPGAENPELACRLQAAGIEVLDACTLVLLKTNQFSKEKL